MLIRSLLALVLATAACGGSKKPEPQPTPSETSDQPAAPDQPANCGVSGDPDVGMTPEQCTCLGGQVRGDIGDGQVACEPNERELGRVATGIEGGVCCAAADAASP